MAITSAASVLVGLSAKPEDMNRGGQLATVRTRQMLSLFTICQRSEDGSLMPSHESCGVAAVELLCLPLPREPIQGLMHLFKQGSLTDAVEGVPNLCSLELLFEHNWECISNLKSSCPSQPGFVQMDGCSAVQPLSIK